MEAKEFDFEFPRGDTPPLSIELTDYEGKKLEINPSNCEITFTARNSDDEIVIQKKYSTGEIEITETKAHFIFKHNDTSNLEIGDTLNYDIQFVSGDYYKTLVIGKIKLTKEITY